MNLKTNVIFRTCDKINAVHGSPRPFNLNKYTLIKICFLSLIKSLEGKQYSIYIVADDISSELTNFFEKYPVTIIHGVFGNDNSLRKCFEIAKNIPKEELIYFCEDDYLHKEDTFNHIIELFTNSQAILPGDITLKKLLRKRELTLLRIKRYFKKPEILVFPCDYPDRYDIRFLQKQYIYQTSKMHWRQVEDITFTFLLMSNSFKKHFTTINKAAEKANDRYLSKKLLGSRFFYNKLLALSPMPSLSCHMHSETMSNIVNWEAIVDEICENNNLWK
jgi:hypothetical protein